MSKTVAFYYSLGSRYSYLASTQIAALERETHARVEWYPVSNVGLMQAAGYQPFAGAPTSGQYDFKFRRADAEAWAAYYGVPYREPADPHGLPPESAIAACAATRMGAVVPFSHAFFRAHFVDGTRIRNKADLTDIAVAAGLDAERFTASLADPATETLHRRRIDQALQSGAFGVPSFVVAGRLFWGNDRLALVRHALSGNDKARDR